MILNSNSLTLELSTLLHIHIKECNPDNDIITNTNTINIDGENADISEDNGRHLFTIPPLDSNGYGTNTTKLYRALQI